MRPQGTPLALWASFIPLCLGINIAPTGAGGLVLARILFGESRDVFSSSSGYSGDPSAIRSFTDGPFGMGSGIILSTGTLASDSLAPGGTCPSSYTTDLYDSYTTSYCGDDTYNGASYLLNILPIKATTLLIDMVIASCDVTSGDKVLIFVNGVNVAKDETGTPLDSSSKYLSEPWGIPSPNGDTAFAMSSPPLRFSIPLPKTYVELKIAVCDHHNGYGDTAVMIKARPCTNCDQSFKVDYDTTSIVSTTTYETTSVVTQAASGTLDNPSYINGVRLSLLCGKQVTGGNQIGYSNQLHSLTECMALCVDTMACRAVTFNNVGDECTLYDGLNGFMSDNNQDMAVVASRPVASSSTNESLTVFSTTTSVSTTSTTAPGPLSCSQMAGRIYTGLHENKFTLSCDNSSTGESIYRRDEEDSMQGCLDRCDNDSRCIAVNFHPYPYSECDMIESFTGTKSTPGTNFASKVLSLVSTSTSSETSISIESASESSASTLYITSSASISSGSPENTSLSSETTSVGTLELPSFTTTLAVTSQADISSPATLSPSIALSSSLDAPSGSTSNPALESTLESTLEPTSLSTASALTSLAAISLSTAFSPSRLPDHSLSLSSEAVSESASDIRLGSTSAGESSLESTTVATTKGSLHTDTTSIEMSTTETLTTKIRLIETSTVEASAMETSVVETSTTTTSATEIETTATGLSMGSTSQDSTEIQSTSSILQPSEVSTLPSTSSTLPARNILAFGEYTFTGCLRSLEGYPSFTEVATDPEMTTRKCVDLALGSEYVGVYKESCYKADLLSDTEFISDTRCDLPCPGDPTLICGGNFRGRQKLLHRAIASDHLLTLYRKTVSSSASYSSSSYTPPSSSLQATGAHTYESTSESSSLSRYSKTTSSYSLSSFTTINLGSKTLSVSDSTITKTTSESRLPTLFPTPTAIHTAFSIVTIDHAYTQTQFAETVTTVTYTTINPSNPAALITTCVPITLLYSPCECEHQVYPSVDMTTVACTHGGDIATLTVPKAAYETGRASYTHPIVQYPSGWVGGYQTDAVGNSYPAVKPTRGSQPGSKNDQPETATMATGLQDSHPSYKTHQPATPTSAVGPSGNTQSEQEDTQPSIPAQGSPESDSNIPMDLSQPSFPKSLTTETGIIPMSQLENSAIPSQSSPPRHGQVPSETKEAPYATPMVVSEAHSYDLSSWIMMTAIVGMVLLPTKAGGAISFNNFGITSGAVFEGLIGHHIKVATTYL
ncbi:hypothetical protein ACJA88_003488 [Fusarium oxysporum]